MRFDCAAAQIRFAIICFSGSAEVAAGLSNPPTLGRRRVGSCTGNGRGWGLDRKKLYRGRGLRLASGPQVSILASEKGWFYDGKMKDLSGGRIPGPGGSPTGSRGGFRRSSGELLGPPEWSKSDEN